MQKLDYVDQIRQTFNDQKEYQILTNTWTIGVNGSFIRAKSTGALWDKYLNVIYEPSSARYV